MNPKKYDIAIVGGGFSGILAAKILSKHGLHILVVDENIHLGGQYLRSHPGQQPSPKAISALKRRGFNAIDSLIIERVHIMTRTEVLGITDEKELLLHEVGKRLYSVKPQVILLATGAREKFIPFKGWTLPGVLSTGATQILLKGSGRLPAREIIVGGMGIFPYAVASEMLMNKGRVLALLDQNRLTEKLRFTKGLFLELSKIGEGMRDTAELARSRTPIQFGKKIIEARGHQSLEEVVTVSIDGNGNIISGTETVYPCNCLAMGFGFVANTELAQQAGCRLGYDPNQGGWIVGVSADLETTVPGIYAAGEITGIAGATKAVTEGKLAALSILLGLGKITRSQFITQSTPLKRDRNRHTRFGRHFNSLHQVKEADIRSIPNETIVCRCEDITIGEIRHAIRNGCESADAVKKAVRPGMGICQGRTCGPIIYEIIAACIKKSPELISPISVRIPLKAVPLKILSGPTTKL